VPDLTPYDKELIDYLVHFIDRERPTLIREWIENFQKIESKTYTNLPTEDVAKGSENFLDTVKDLMVEKDDQRVMAIMEGSMRSVIQRRVIQGVGLEYILKASLLHRDVLLTRLISDESYRSLPDDQKLAITNLVYHYFGLLHNGIANMTHEVAIGEIDRLRRFNENIISSVTEGIIIEDHNGVVTYANPKFASMLGYQKEELIGEHWEKVVAKDQLKLFREEASKRSLGMDGKFEGNLVTKDGTLLPVLISARPLYESGRFRGVLSVIMDVTDLRRMQNELQRSKKETERLNTELETHAKQLEQDNIKLRAILNIEPQKEQESKGEKTFVLEPGYIYMLLSQETETSFRIFEDLVKHAHPGLLVSRILPDTIRKVYSLEKTPILWLTTNKVPNQHCVTPSNIVDMSSAIINFMEKTKNGVILLEGIEYLLSQNQFRSILNLIQLLNDKIMLNKSMIVMPLDPEVIDPKELHQIMKEVRIFEDTRVKDLRRMPITHF